MDTFNLPKAINSCILYGRQLYYRLVFLLGMNPSLSIEIIAFWLLVEGNGEVDFLRHINSFYGDQFLALVGMGKQFIDAMYGTPVDLKSGSAREFHGQVMLGICFILNNVCYKVLNDLRQKAEQGVAIQDIEESPYSNYHGVRQYMKDQPRITTNCHQYEGDRSISRIMPTDTKCRDSMEGYPDSVLHQYMKDHPHISTSYDQYQGECSISRSMSSAIKYLQDMEESSGSNYHVFRQLIKDPNHANNNCHQYEGDCSILRSMHATTKCLEDMEESPNSNYQVLHQYMKDWPHISNDYDQYQGDCSISRRMPSAIKCLGDMEESSGSNYPLIHQYIKDRPHISNSYDQHQGNYSISRTIPSVIKYLEDMMKTRDEVQSVNAFSSDLGNMVPHQQNNTRLSISSGSIIVPTAIQNNQDMVEMRYGARPMNAFLTDLDIISPQQRQTIEVNISSDTHGLESLFRNLRISPQFPSEWGNKSPQSSTMNMNPYVHSPSQHHALVPQEDKTLFVTFSNGYPFTKVEVYNFFMSNFGDVESLSIEEPVELRPPQYALVTFGSLETVLLILDGEEKAKFLVGGKHLWARRYVPKGKSKAWM